MPSTCTQIKSLDIERLWKVSRGAGVRVAVLDTGVDTSRALPEERVECVDADGGAPDPSSDAHGTFCASVIASEAKNAEGIAPEARILSIQIATESDAISAAAVARGLELALDRECDVISCSFTLRRLGTKAGEIAELVRTAHLRGIPVLAAHGNTQGEPAPFPEDVQHAIVVSAHSLRGNPLSVNANQWTDVFSLGERLTVVSSAGALRVWPGKTSGATACVAGIVALGLAAVAKSQRARIGVAVDGLLKASADDGGSLADVPSVRLVNAAGFLDAVLAL
jgi:subtilisin family serine protease